jgi:hypothetical protein
MQAQATREQAVAIRIVKKIVGSATRRQDTARDEAVPMFDVPSGVSDDRGPARGAR